MSNFTDEYKNLSIIQYSDKPTFNAILTALLEQFEKVHTLYKSFDDAYDVDKAVGKQLDVLGKIVGIGRTVPTVLLKKYFSFSGTFNGGAFGKAPFKTGNEATYSDTQLNNEDYRFLIKAKIIRNFTYCSLSKPNKLNMQKAIDYLFNNKGWIKDNYNMTFDLYVSEVFDLDKIALIQALDLFPLPKGTRINQIITY